MQIRKEEEPNLPQSKIVAGRLQTQVFEYTLLVWKLQLGNSKKKKIRMRTKKDSFVKLIRGYK